MGKDEGCITNLLLTTHSSLIPNSEFCEYIDIPMPIYLSNQCM